MGYYLNKSITFYRHLSLRLMLLGLPLLMCATGIRLLIKFDRDIMPGGPKVVTEDKPIPHAPPDGTLFHGHVSIMGLFTCAVFFMSSIALFQVHRVHDAVFKERYAIV